MKNKCLTFMHILIAFIIIISINNCKIYAANLSGNQIFKIHGKTITMATNVDQLSNMFGSPKITIDSPFGGKAYTYYDLNENWVLHIETNVYGVIKAYGGASSDFVAKDYKFGQQNDDKAIFLKGTRLHYMDFFADTDEVLGFYGYTDLSEQERKNYWNNYIANQNKYLVQMQESAVIFSKVARAICSSTNSTFNQIVATQDVLDVVEQLNNVGQSITDYSINSGKSAYLSFTTSQKVTYNECYPNPLYLAQATIGYTKDESTYPYFIFNTRINKYEEAYQTAEAIIEGVYIDPTFMENKEEVDLTDNEIRLIDNVKKAYKEYTDYGKQIQNESLWIKEPVYDTLPLVAGQMNFNAVESATLYLNAIRAGQDLQPLKADERLTEGAQHKAVLVLYLNNSTAQTYKHFFEKPDFLDQDFYDKAMIGVGENLYMGSYISSISYALNDKSGDPVTCGHRYNLLEPDYTIWGIGQAGPGFVYQTQTCHKFIGGTATKNDLVAWPANGITLINAIAGGIGNWTAQFYRYNYDTLNVDTITVKNLSTGKTFEFENEIDDPYLVSWNADEVTYESGDVFEITLHNIKNLNTKQYEDYTYRSIFISISNTEEAKEGVSITTNIDAKIMEKGETFKIDATLNNAQNLSNKLMKFKSSNEKVLQVRQNGTITALKGGSATITIYSEEDPTIQKTVVVTVNKAPGDDDDDNPDNPEIPDEPTPEDPKPDDPPILKVGDLDRNGVIDANDASIALELYKAENATIEDIIIGDLDENEIIDANDASLILEIYKTSN